MTLFLSHNAYLVCSGIISLTTSIFGSSSVSLILVKSVMCHTTFNPPPILEISFRPVIHRQKIPGGFQNLAGVPVLTEAQFCKFLTIPIAIIIAQ